MLPKKAVRNITVLGALVIAIAGISAISAHEVTVQSEPRALHDDSEVENLKRIYDELVHLEAVVADAWTYDRGRIRTIEEEKLYFRYDVLLNEIASQKQGIRSYVSNMAGLPQLHRFGL